MAEGVLEITDSNFATEVEKSPIPVLVDFWATWCGPCQRIAPIVAELAKENHGRVRIGKVDVDNNPGVAERFGVASIPTLVMLKAGQEVDRTVGAVPKSVLQQMINKHA